MRVLMLSWEYPPLVYGGLSRHVHGLSESLAEGGHEVVVVTQHTEDTPPDAMVNGVRVIRVPQDPPLVPIDDLLAWTMALDHALTRAAVAVGSTWRPDVVHGHDWLVAHTGATLKEAWSIPLVATVHATEAGRHQGWLPGPLNQAINSLEWWLTYQARRVITCSQAMRWEVTRLFELPAGKVDVIPNGVDTARWRSSDDAVRAARVRWAGGPAAAGGATAAGGPAGAAGGRPTGAAGGPSGAGGGSGADGPLLLFSGRLEYEKGVHTVLDAMRSLRRQHPALRLVIAGRGSQEDALRAQARRLRLGRSVRFAGWLDDDDLSAMAAAADLALVPSLYEPFGLVALEAAAAGTPVVATDRGGLGEVVRGSRLGLTVPGSDPAALADAVTSLLADQVLARRIGREARDTVESTYSWPVVARATAAAYRRAIRDERVLRARAGTAYADPRPNIRVREGNLLRGE
jgi:glycogen synthase